MLILVLLLLTHLSPNPALTPGIARPMTLQVLCSTRWGLDRRHVTVAMRRQVFAAYGIPYEQHARYELDHLIPRELGGADDIRNLWPQRWPDAHVKDRYENALHVAVCRGRLSLADAQAEMKRWGQRP